MIVKSYRFMNKSEKKLYSKLDKKYPSQERARFVAKEMMTEHLPKITKKEAKKILREYNKGN